MGVMVRPTSCIIKDTICHFPGAPSHFSSLFTTDCLLMSGILFLEAGARDCGALSALGTFTDIAKGASLPSAGSRAAEEKRPRLPSPHSQAAAESELELRAVWPPRVTILRIHGAASSGKMLGALSPSSGLSDLTFLISKVGLRRAGFPPPLL